MKTFLLALALPCILASTLHAQLDGTDPQYRTLCRESLAKPFTPPPADPAIKSDCDSTVSYFGIGQPVDYKAALACAYAEYAHPNTTFNPFPGAGVLSMIYANGQGTTPNLDLATRFTCENFSAPAEIEARLDILAADRETHSINSFELCATSSSANTNDWCTSIEARQSEVERNRGIAAFSSTLPQGAILPLAALQIAETDFENARIQNELDLTGPTPTFVGFHTAEKNFADAHTFDNPALPAPGSIPKTSHAPSSAVRTASQLEEQNDLGDRFLDDLKHITDPSFVEKTNLKTADKDLDTTLKRVRLNAPKHLQHTTITYKGVEETQRLWFNLRDSWLAFITATNPPPALAEQALAHITLERSHQLSKLNDTPHDH